MGGVKDQLLELFDWLEPFGVVSHRQMALLLKVKPHDRFPNHGLISFVLREKYPPNEEFARRVAALHSYVEEHRDSLDLVEFVGRHFQVPVYEPADRVRFHSGALRYPGDLILSGGKALALLPDSMLGCCPVCGEYFIKKCWCHRYCAPKCRRQARNERRREQSERRVEVAL